VKYVPTYRRDEIYRNTLKFIVTINSSEANFYEFHERKRINFYEYLL